MGHFNSKCNSTIQLNGKTSIITGSNSGIGLETAKEFFRRGARVIMACRDLDKAQKVVDLIKCQYKDDENVGELKVTKLDLMSLKSVRTCANYILENEEHIDLLINNAGIMMCPFGRTEDGFEIQFGTNHLGHFLFTMLLLPKLCRSQSARIVNVSSIAHTMVSSMNFDDLNWHTRRYSALKAYQESKLANVLFTQELAKRLKENNMNQVTTYALHPGVIATDLSRHLDDTYIPGVIWLWRNISRPFIKTPEQGAQTTIYCAIDEKCANESGLYYAECSLKQTGKGARNKDDSARILWEKSWKLVQLEPDYNPFNIEKK